MDGYVSGSPRGAKGDHLAWLIQNGFRVPAGFVVTPEVDDVEVALARHLTPGRRYVVRSSSMNEDGHDATFAGQYVSHVGVREVEAVAAAVAEVRRSASGDRARAYHGVDGTEMFVIVQEMADPVVSGVAFTRNPMTGLNETVVEAVAGTGESLMSGGADPYRWIHRWGSFVVTPDSPIVDEEVIGVVIREAAEIERRYGSPVDLEWVYDGTTVWWVQLRPIGRLDVTVYSNRIAREVLPGAIKPLVWSVNVPLVNGAWVRLFDEALGPTGIRPEDLARPFGYHAYFNMSAMGNLFEMMGMPRDSLELLIGLPPGPDRPSMRPGLAVLRLVPRLVAFASRRGRAEGATRRLLATMPDRLRPHDPSHAGTDGTAAEIWAHLAALDELVGEVAAANIVVPLLYNAWSGLLGKQAGDVDLLRVDLDAGLAELLAYDPNPALARLGAELEGPEAEAALAGFLDRFGHLSDSGNDLSQPTWRERPELVAQLARAARDRPAQDDRMSVESFIAAVPRHRRPVVRFLVGRVRTYRVLREAVGSLYTAAYDLYRGWFLELGRRLVDSGVIDDVDDVFFLSRSEVADPPEGALALVAARRSEIAEAALLELPETVYGDEFVPRRRRAASEGLHRGVGTSRGTYTGPARVIRSVDEGGRLRPGDVLVVPYSDVGWTPLFGRAGAVVAESGGMLSHSSIVAREYGIPCVVSVPQACSIPDGTTVTVDGHHGEVFVEDAP